MKKYKFDTFHEDFGDTREQKEFYLASEVDARIAELEKRYERALAVLALADKYIPTSKLDAYTAEARALMGS